MRKTIMKQLKGSIYPIFASRSVWMFVFLLGLVMTISPITYAAALAQVVPYTGNGTDTFHFQEAYITTPDPSISAGQWAAAPNGVTNWSNIFIESGPIKECGLFSCTRRPYASWQTSGGSSGFVKLSNNLTAGGWYQYKAYNYGGNNWTAVFCSGNGCSTIANANLGVGSLPYVASGGEGSSTSVHFGSITSKWNRAYKNGSYTYWCYTAVVNNVSGTVSTCNTSDYSWTVSY